MMEYPEKFTSPGKCFVQLSPCLRVCLFIGSLFVYLVSVVSVRSIVSLFICRLSISSTVFVYSLVIVKVLVCDCKFISTRVCLFVCLFINLSLRFFCSFVSLCVYFLCVNEVFFIIFIATFGRYDAKQQSGIKLSGVKDNIASVCPKFLFSRFFV